MSQNSSNNSATLNGLFKQVYSKEVQQAIPDFAIIQKRVPFSKASMLGDKYHLPVVLADEHGFTFGGNSAANYALNTAISMQMQDAQVNGYEITLQSGVSYGAVSRAESKGTGAVEGVVSLLIERMKASMAKRVELSLLYGGVGIGQVASGTGSSTNRVYIISASSFAAGIWAGFENCSIDFYNGSSKLNTNAPVVITAINVTTRALTVTGNATDLTAIDTAGTSAVIYQYGAYGNEAVGLDSILSNTGALFNIDASVYNLWKANTYDCLSGPLTMAKVLSAANLAVSRGLTEGIQLLVAPDSYANLNSTLAGARQYDSSYKSTMGENGFEALKYHSSAGPIEVICHPMIKSGVAYMLPFDSIQRVGSTDVSFQGKGPQGDEEYLVQNPTTNGWTCRGYTDQAIMLTVPAQAVKLINIVPTP